MAGPDTVRVELKLDRVVEGWEIYKGKWIQHQPGCSDCTVVTEEFTAEGRVGLDYTVLDNFKTMIMINLPVDFIDEIVILNS